MSATDQAPTGDTGWAAYRRLLGYLRPLIGYFMLSIFGYLLYAGTQAAFVKLMEFIVDTIGKGESDARVIIPLSMIGIFVVRGIGFFLGGFYMAHVARNIVHALRIEIFDHLLRVPSRYYDDTNSGHTISKVTYNVEQVTGAVTAAIKTIVREGLTVIILLSYLVYLNWRLSLVFLVVGPLIALVVGYASRRFRKLSKRIQNSMGNVTHVASEAINGYRVVRTFGGEDYERQRFFEASHYNLKQSMKMVITSSISTPVVQTITAMAMGFLVWMALHPSVLADTSPGQFIAFLTAAGMLAKPIRQLTEVNATIQAGVAAAQSIFGLLDQPVEVDTGRRVFKDTRGDVEFRDVDFAYAVGQDLVLKKISFKISAGEQVAFVGKSGSGKTTLVSLLPRFYETTSGDILIDGHPIRDYQLRSLRSQIALVTQHVTLFNDTLANNIAYGDMAGATDEEVIEAARAAHVMEFVEDWPDGIHTMVGENGVLLSGGQRQRLAIARAILKDAPILILDEATSALDTQSERHIQAALEAVMEGRTTLVIAHRLSTIESADRIIVLHDGEIVESGSHQQLLETDGAYAQLHRMQFREEALEAGDQPGESADQGKDPGP